MTHDRTLHTRRTLLARLGRAALTLAVASRVAPPLLAQSAAPARPLPWADGLELAVNFSFRAPGGRYNRPYAAVWIEDERGTPVRTLSLWASSAPGKQKYLAELRRWWRGEQKRRATDSTDLVSTVSSPPPRRELHSSGTGGATGTSRSRQGNYVLCLEMAREDGPYGRVRQPLTIGASPFRTAVDGDGELTDVTAELRRRN